MSTIALISCTSCKKPYKCEARELYSESPRFRLSYELARMTADKIFILSAKYGLVPEDKLIEPYNETLKEKSSQERHNWAIRVLSELNRAVDTKEDDFIILAGEVYNENLLPHIRKHWLPLKGKALGEWIPELERLIKLEKTEDTADALHILMNSLPRFDWTMIDMVPYRNGIYIMFEKDEEFHGMDRIVHIGTNRSQNRLRMRLQDHFIVEDSDGSILRKNIGRAFLNKSHDSYLKVWDIDMHVSGNRRRWSSIVDESFETELEDKISDYLRDNMTFTCFPVEDGEERLRLKEGIIAVLNSHQSFSPGRNWLGLYSPIEEIRESGLWNRQGLKGMPLTKTELERIKRLIRFNSHGDGIDGQRAKTQGTVKNDRMIEHNFTPNKKGADDIRIYIEYLFRKAIENGKDCIELTSGSIHKELSMNNRMPQVCRIMYEKMKTGDEILHTTPSGNSSTIRIRYYLNK